MKLLARGRDADVFALDEDRVLRRYRDGRTAAAEAELVRAITGSGFPTPRVHAADGPDLVLDRVDGPDLLTAVAAGVVPPDDAGRVLADLHQRLHALPWPGGSLLHLDLHPLNVLWTAAGAVLLDWTNARAGDPELDVAVTALILAQVAVAPEAFDDAGVDPDAADALAAMLAGFAAAAGRYADRLDDAAAWRGRDPNAGPRERETLDEAVSLARSYARA
jgi:aminoglycoside phosphotransferase (APT) family kinase protein